jgi:molybdopterin synthase sulfur carrier subunit
MEWRLFADVAEVAGTDRIEVEVEPGGSVEDALAALLADRPALRERVLDGEGELESHVNVLRNGENAALSDPVSAGDELALFPPVSGG